MRSTHPTVCESLPTGVLKIWGFENGVTSRTWYVLRAYVSDVMVKQVLFHAHAPLMRLCRGASEPIWRGVPMGREKV